jgi:hypothetical protein
VESSSGSHRRRLSDLYGLPENGRAMSFRQIEAPKDITVGLVPTVTGLVSNRSWRRMSPLIGIQTEVS